uniref:Uncharacterized protein n=1 Tax=Ciona savignyi TaxID=51511 RepID=H2ZB24_CIOSA
MNCKAKIKIVHLIKFPDCQIFTKKLFEQRAVSKLIRKSLSSNDDDSLVKEYAWHVTLPANEEHSGHFLGEEAGNTQPVDKSIVKKIDELVKDGIYLVPEIRQRLKDFVLHELFKDRDPPSESNRRFFPTKKDIQNHCNMSFAKRKVAKVDCDTPQQVTIDAVAQRLDEIKSLSHDVYSQKVLNDMLSDLNSALSKARTACSQNLKSMKAKRKRSSCKQMDADVVSKQAKINTLPNQSTSHFANTMPIHQVTILYPDMSQMPNTFDPAFPTTFLPAT